VSKGAAYHEAAHAVALVAHFGPYAVRRNHSLGRFYVRQGYFG
jgi:hypothetical protein